MDFERSVSVILRLPLFILNLKRKIQAFKANLAENGNIPPFIFFFKIWPLKLKKLKKGIFFEKKSSYFEVKFWKNRNSRNFEHPHLLGLVLEHCVRKQN